MHTAAASGHALLAAGGAAPQLVSDVSTTGFIPMLEDARALVGLGRRQQQQQQQVVAGCAVVAFARWSTIPCSLVNYSLLVTCGFCCLFYGLFLPSHLLVYSFLVTYCTCCRPVAGRPCAIAPWPALFDRCVNQSFRVIIQSCDVIWSSPGLGRSFNSKPSTLDPRPSTLYPRPSTLNPRPSTLNPLPSTLDPQP